jgi:hypothetical protein
MTSSITTEAGHSTSAVAAVSGKGRTLTTSSPTTATSPQPWTDAHHLRGVAHCDEPLLCRVALGVLAG